METAVELTNEISKLILREKDINVIKKEVKKFDELLDECCRNFYEVKMDMEAPLFELCEVLELGADNYDMDETEFNKYIDDILQEITNIFGVVLIID